MTDIIEVKKTMCKSKDTDYVKSYNKQYYEINKDKRKQDDIKKNIAIVCTCGKRVKGLGMSSHIKTSYHLIYNNVPIESSEKEKLVTPF